MIATGPFAKNKLATLERELKYPKIGSSETLSVRQWPHHGRLMPESRHTGSWGPQWMHEIGQSAIGFRGYALASSDYPGFNDSKRGATVRWPSWLKRSSVVCHLERR